MKLPAKEVLVSLPLSMCAYLCVRETHTYAHIDLHRSKVLKVRPWT